MIKRKRLIVKLGWEDTQELERYTKNLHSKWSLQDLKNCGLFPYIKNCFSKSKNFKFDEKKISIIELNLVKSDDVQGRTRMYKQIEDGSQTKNTRDW